MWRNQRIKLGTKCVGTVVGWDCNRGFGFIRPDPQYGNQDIVILRNHIKEKWISDLYKGQRVYFNIEETEKGLLATHLKFEKYQIRPLNEESK